MLSDAKKNKVISGLLSEVRVYTTDSYVGENTPDLLERIGLEDAKRGYRSIEEDTEELFGRLDES